MNLYSGNSFIMFTAVEKVRWHFSLVWRTGHSQAVSMWEWPMQTTLAICLPHFLS